MRFQLFQPNSGRHTGALPQLIALIKNSSIGAIGSQCLVESLKRPGYIITDVVVADSKVSPDGSERPVQMGGIFPQLHRFLAAASGVQQIGQIILRTSIMR